jgi:hypothetical protein
LLSSGGEDFYAAGNDGRILNGILPEMMMFNLFIRIERINSAIILKPHACPERVIINHMIPLNQGDKNYQLSAYGRLNSLNFSETVNIFICSLAEEN